MFSFFWFTTIVLTLPLFYATWVQRSRTVKIQSKETQVVGRLIWIQAESWAEIIYLKMFYSCTSLFDVFFKFDFNRFSLTENTETANNWFVSEFLQLISAVCHQIGLKLFEMAPEVVTQRFAVYQLMRFQKVLTIVIIDPNLSTSFERHRLDNDYMQKKWFYAQRRLFVLVIRLLPYQGHKFTSPSQIYSLLSNSRNYQRLLPIRC